MLSDKWKNMPDDNQRWMVQVHTTVITIRLNPLPGSVSLCRRSIWRIFTLAGLLANRWRATGSVRDDAKLQAHLLKRIKAVQKGKSLPAD